MKNKINIKSKNLNNCKIIFYLAIKQNPIFQSKLLKSMMTKSYLIEFSPIKLSGKWTPIWTPSKTIVKTSL